MAILLSRLAIQVLRLLEGRMMVLGQLWIHQVGLVYRQVVSVRRRVVLCLHREVAVM